MTSYLRYKQELKCVQDADDTDIESWITVRGNHIPIKKGQSKEEAVQSFIESKGGKYKKESYGKHYVKYGEGENKRYASPRNDLIYSDKSRAGFFGSEKEAKEYAKKLNHTDPYAGTPFAMKNYKRTVLPYEVESEQESKYDPEFEVVRKNALANGNVYGGRYTQKSKAEAYKEYKKDTVVLKDPKTGKEIVANLSDVKSDDNVMPSANEYGKYLDTITSKTGISREDARKKYGQYTIAQWNELLSRNDIKNNIELKQGITPDMVDSAKRFYKSSKNLYGESSPITKKAKKILNDWESGYKPITPKKTKEDVEKHLKGLTKKSATDSWKRLWGKK